MENQLLNAVKIVESKLDAELERLDNLDDDELERIRRSRIEQMKTAQKDRQEWSQNGHGQYTELADEREFFEACKKSKHVVCHFYRESTFRCKIIDKHLSLIAKQHMECKFVKVNVEKFKFLCERLRIKTIPTISLIRDNKPIDYIVGFTDLGNTDEFETELLEWRLGTQGVIDYSGDLMNPPNATGSKKTIKVQAKSTIRNNMNNADSDDEGVNDW